MPVHLFLFLVVVVVVVITIIRSTIYLGRAGDTVSLNGCALLAWCAMIPTVLAVVYEEPDYGAYACQPDGSGNKLAVALVVHAAMLAMEVTATSDRVGCGDWQLPYPEVAPAKLTDQSQDDDQSVCRYA